jgi:hypothetical protein
MLVQCNHNIYECMTLTRRSLEGSVLNCKTQSQNLSVSDATRGPMYVTTACFNCWHVGVFVVCRLYKLVGHILVYSDLTATLSTVISVKLESS